MPTLVRPVANPIVDRVARESLNRTLVGLIGMMNGKAHSQARSQEPTASSY